MKMLSVYDMTLGEAELFEEHGGISVMDVFREAAASENGTIQLPLKAITTLLWLDLRREDPEASLDQVRAMKVTDMPTAVDFGEDEEDADEQSDEPDDPEEDDEPDGS